MTSLRFGLSMCVAGLLVAGCPSDDSGDDGNDDAANTSAATDDTAGQEEGSTATPSDSTGGGMTDLSHDADIQPIWNAHCTTACHEPGGAWVTFVDLSDGAYDRIVGQPAVTVPSINFIEPGDPDASYIWHKIQGTQAMVDGGNGDGMPYPSSNPPTMLSQEEFDTIEEWILGGAPQ